MNAETETVECQACDWVGQPAAAYQTKDGLVCPDCIDEGGHSKCVPVRRHASPLSAKEEPELLQCPECAFTGNRLECFQTLKGLHCRECRDHPEMGPVLLPPKPRPPEPITPTGIEAMVCADIAKRQQLGIKKYGCTVAESPDDMLQHAYEEALDLAVYLRAEMEGRGA